MTQHPVDPTCNEHASESSGSISNDNSQKRSMEPDIEVPNSSDRDKASSFPFLKLPTEIRLEVYTYLLIAAPFWSRYAEVTGRLSKGVVLDIYRPRKKKAACRRINRGLKAHASTGLTPQILCACKAINREATAIRYGGNTFQFRTSGILPPWDFNVTKKEVRRYLDQEVYPKLLYCENRRPNSALFNSTLAVFLRQIGPLNATNLKKLKFIRRAKAWYQSGLKETGWTIALVTRLLKCLTPAVSQIKFCLTSIPWDEFESGPFELTKDKGEHTRPLAMWDSDGASDLDYPLNEELKASLQEQEVMFTAIKYLAEEVSSLKQLRVTGFNKSHQVYQKVQRLQASIDDRR